MTQRTLRAATFAAGEVRVASCERRTISPGKIAYLPAKEESAILRLAKSSSSLILSSSFRSSLARDLAMALLRILRSESMSPASQSSHASSSFSSIRPSAAPPPGPSWPVLAVGDIYRTRVGGCRHPPLLWCWDHRPRPSFAPSGRPHRTGGRDAAPGKKPALGTGSSDNRSSGTATGGGLQIWGDGRRMFEMAKN